jgi:hypothetical protein
MTIGQANKRDKAMREIGVKVTDMKKMKEGINFVIIFDGLNERKKILSAFMEVLGTIPT